MAKNKLQLGDTWGDLEMSFNTYEDDFNVQEINKTVHFEWGNISQNLLI